ncbi:serine/threonine-protein kinase [Streptomyces yerevanensis]|uniref:serine/threonine-protein kinase n=1 Tax=Streptomyces yerevanensis TaxID=66378 RepID=UPI000525E12F|nr:serine/threonine-protein kinase [Streptomyces yerevanensis]
MSDEGRLVAGRYRLVERIGRGGMGTVWRAEDEVLGRQIALKQLHSHHHLSGEELATLYERMRREARSAARIAHPNVVVVHDVVDDEGLPCVAMEYVPSVTLGDLLKNEQTLPPAEAARIGLGMIAALRAAHAAGVLHRDVKPGNVLLASDGRVVLTDFGIAMTDGTSTLTKTGELVGSIDYMAPERMRGLTPGPASDLWALGATLHQAVEGRPPFRKDTAMETAYAIATDPLGPMEQAGALEPLIEALLVKDPDERPSAEQTERALRTVRAGEPTEVLRSAAFAGTGSGTRTGSGTGTGSGSVTGSGTGSAAGRGRRPDVPDASEVPGTPDAPGVPTRTDTGGNGRGRERSRAGGRGRKRRRALLWSTVAATVAGAAVAGVLYTTAYDGGATDDGAARNPGTTAAPPYKPPPVPEGYHLVRDKRLGVSFPVPDGWKAAKKTPDEVSYTDPTKLAEITVGVVDPAGSHPVEHFKTIEANTKVNYPNSYRKLRMQKTTFRGQPAAVWEFTFQGRARAFRAIDLGYGREGAKEYDIYLSAPDAQWATFRPVFDKVRNGFTTTS